MSILNEYRKLEQALKACQERLESLKHSEQLSRDLAFEQKLLTLLKRHSMGIEDLLVFIPKATRQCVPTLQEESPAYKACPPVQRKAGRPRIKA